MSMPQLIAGLDLGKNADFSALAVVERTVVPAPVAKRRYSYALRWLETWELGTLYARIIAGVRDRFDTPALRRRPLAVDYTGVGTAVVEQIAAARVPARLHPILITAGHQISRPEETKERAWHVPKKELVSTLVVLLENRLLRWAAPGTRGALPLAGRFEKELADFRVMVTRARNETFGADASQHDDLVLAVALACWLGEHVGCGDVAGIGGPEWGKGCAVEAAPEGVFVDSGREAGRDADGRVVRV